MDVPVQLLDPDATVPTYAHAGDAGCDLVAVESVTLGRGGGRALVRTGLSVAIPEGHGGFVLPRSGLAMRHGVTCINAPGLIDPGYRGEVKVALVNLDPTHDYVIEPGDRIAQLVVLPVDALRFALVDGLEASSRSGGGFGSTGR
jgi:dUTP pyrophosphatase